MFSLPFEGTTSSLMSWVGFCASLSVVEEIVESVNAQMNREENMIRIISSSDVIFELKWNLEEQRYFTIAIVGNRKVEELDGKVCGEFDKDFYMQIYPVLKSRIPDEWEKKLNKTVWWELLGTNWIFNKTWYGKIKPSITRFETPIMQYFQISLFEQVFHGSKETVVEITPMIKSTLGSWIVGSIAESCLKNSYNQNPTTVRIETYRYSEQNKGHYKQVISNVIANQIKQLVKTQVL
ncbi:hypothetical protein [Aeromonas phage AerS_266]|nr:hypothetical protein [Aeromonas phage AerS_266]